MKLFLEVVAIPVLSLTILAASEANPAASFHGRYFAGEGDQEYLQLLDIARRMYEPDPEFQNFSMLYKSSWNGFVEGPTWDAWWIQNSYGTTYASLPFFEEPFVSFLQNAQDLWFNKMGDGKTSYVWNGKDSWVPPDGCLMDCANLTWAMHKQGDGRVSIHDWGMEFTAAGALLQSELLLISRDMRALANYLPKLERCARFIESRRDPKNNLFLAGPAGNLLAPSYAGYKKPDGTYGQAYLTGLSVTYIAFLDRLAELETLAGRTAQARIYTDQRAAARKGLEALTTEEGYLIKSMDPDGTRHGVYGAARYGYFEASPNHDAICFRVVDDSQALKIYQKMSAIPGLRPYDLIVANAPSLDDMYEAPQGLWGFGTWVNGGHWTTCEARMMMAYYRLGKQDDARRAMKQMLSFARQFRMDNPLVKFGSDVYQPNEPINLTYDAFGAPAGLIRGLFEYLYRADGLTLVPHIPAGITQMEQKFPIRFGNKRLYLAMAGNGPITRVLVNGKAWKSFDAQSVFLKYEATPKVAAIQVLMGKTEATPFKAPAIDYTTPIPPALENWPQAEPTVISANELPLRIGADSNGGSRFSGDIARIYLFNRVLSPDEIKALAQGDPKQWAQDPAVAGIWILDQMTNGAIADIAGKAPPAKAVGKVEIVDSKYGKVIHLSGEGYLQIAPSPLLNLTKGGTWYALVRPAKTAGRIIDKCPVGGDAGYVLDTHPGNALRLIADVGAIASPAPLTAGQWYDIVATVRSNGDRAIYLDGRSVTSATGITKRIDIQRLLERTAKINRFHARLVKARLGDTYEAAHARLVGQYIAIAGERRKLIEKGTLLRLPERSQTAADKLYLTTATALGDGLTAVLDSYETSKDTQKQRIFKIWKDSQ